MGEGLYVDLVLGGVGFAALMVYWLLTGRRDSTLRNVGHGLPALGVIVLVFVGFFLRHCGQRQ